MTSNVLLLLQIYNLLLGISMNNCIKNTPRVGFKGLSLIEVLVTITITSIGLMGLISLQMQAVRATNDAGNRSQAVWVWNDMANRIRANKVASSSYAIDGPIDCGVPAIICSSFHNGTGLVNPAASCTGAELAIWDRYEVACQLRPAPFIGDANKYLPEIQLTITCPAAPCNNGDPLNISLTWRARSDDQVITGNSRDANSGLLTISDVMNP